MFISPISGIRAHGGMGQRWPVYWGSFCSWSRNRVCILKTLSQIEHCGSLLQLEWGRYITPSKSIKPTQTILKKAQQRSIIVNGARQRWGARFPWRIKDVRGWHMKAHGWCTSEGKSSLGKGERVGLIHGPQRGLETHREAKTHMWGGDCWVYTCE